MDRIKLSTLATRVKPLRLERARDSVIEQVMIRFIATNGRTVFQVELERLFDADSNWFEDDLD